MHRFPSRSRRLFVELLKSIKARIGKRDKQIAQAHGQSETSRLLAAIPGIGNSPQSPAAIASLAATAITASLPDASVFKSGRDFSAWLGLTPRRNSSGEKG